MKLITLWLIAFGAAIAGPQILAQSHREVNAPVTQMIDVGGYKLRMRSAGELESANPTVIFEAGGGDRLETWQSIFSQIARLTHVVSYDRTGMGESEVSPEQRSFVQYAAELHTLLQRADIRPPYVLVGHSFGGACIRAFAHSYPTEVAGLVFVDPLNERVFEIAPQDVRNEQLTQLDAQKSAEAKMLASEVRSGFRELRSFGKPPDVPMMLLIAGRDRGEDNSWEKALIEEYGMWMIDSTEGGIVFDRDSGHYIQRDDPNLVISAIRRVIFPSALNVLASTIKTDGVPAAVNLYRKLKVRYPDDLLPERTLNTLGYQRLRANDVTGAILLFKLNVEMYPRSSNVYDSLGESYMKHGDDRLAIANYKISLKLDQENTNAKAMIKKLETHQ